MHLFCYSSRNVRRNFQFSKAPSFYTYTHAIYLLLSLLGTLASLNVLVKLILIQ